MEYREWDGVNNDYAKKESLLFYSCLFEDGAAFVEFCFFVGWLSFGWEYNKLQLVSWITKNATRRVDIYDLGCVSARFM